MVIFLSLLTAAIFGTGDFCGGMAAKETPALKVVGLSHVVGLVGVFAASLIVADEFIAGDFLLGMLGGGFGGLGVVLLYRCLARGPMSVVAPLTAITSALVPALWGIAKGERLSLLVWVGLALALVAIGLVSSAPDDGDEVGLTAVAVAEALLAGAGFGFFFIFIDATNEASSPWPIVGARLFTGVFLLAWLIYRRQPLRPSSARLGWLIAATGIFDTASNVLFLYATNRGMLTLVSVLSSLYPAATVVLARIFLAERMGKLQIWGFVVAMVATGCIAAG